MKILLIAFLTIEFAILLHAAELKIQGAQYGQGKHTYRSIDEIEKNVTGLVISEISKNNFTYSVTTNANPTLVISRNYTQNPGKTEDLFEFNHNFGTVSPTHVEDAWIVDVFAEEHQISFLMAVSTGYLYVTITDDLNKYAKDGLILPASGVGKGKWNVIGALSMPTRFDTNFATFCHGDQIKQIKLNSLHIAQIQFVKKVEASLFDFSGDFIKKDEVILENENIENPSVLKAVDFFAAIPDKQSAPEREFLKNWVNGRQGGKKQVIEQIKRFSDDPRSIRALSLIEDVTGSE